MKIVKLSVEFEVEDEVEDIIIEKWLGNLLDEADYEELESQIDSELSEQPFVSIVY